MNRVAFRILPFLFPLLGLGLYPMYTVILSSLAAVWNGNQVVVTWTTTIEVNNVGFKVLRSASSNGSYIHVSGFIPSQCLSCITSVSYSFNDTNATPVQTYYYKLQAIDTRGATVLFGPAIATPPAMSSSSAPSEVPETDTLILLGSGIGGLATWVGWKWKRIQRKAAPSVETDGKQYTRL